MSISGFKEFYGKEGSYVTPHELFDWVRSHPMPDGRMIPVVIWGSKGTGKTQQIKAYCEERDLDIASYHPAHDTSGQDILGEPKIDPETDKVIYSLPEWLPTEPGNGGVWFIDEINRAQTAVLAGLMEPLGEGTISQTDWKIPKGWMIIAAANPTETGYLVEEVDEAMVDRMLHYSPGWEAPVWGHWASTKGNVHSDIVDFVFRNPETLPAVTDLGQSQLPHEIEAKLGATPRSLTYFASLYEPGMSESMLRVVAHGLLGREAGEAFIATLKSKEKALLAREILADPIQTASGAKVYEYDQTLQVWRENIPLYERFFEASVQHLVVELLKIGKYNPENLPASESKEIDEIHSNVKKNIIARKAGRFLASLPGKTKDQGYGIIDRSAPEWSAVISESMLAWSKELARTGKLTSKSAQKSAPVLNPTIEQTKSLGSGQ